MEDDQIAMQVLADTLFGKGWSRALPASMIEVFTQILFEQPPTRAELDARLRQSRHSPEGLDSSAWEPLHDWTDEEIARLDEDFGQPDDEPRAASELNAKEAAQREIDLATFERYLAEGEPKGQSFLEWVDSDAYDEAAIKADFRAQMWGRLLTEGILKRE